MTNTILIVDQSSTARRQVAQALGQAGYDILEAADGRAALELIDRARVRAMIVGEVDRSVIGGLQVIKSLQARHIAVPVIMLTGDSDPVLLGRARLSGAHYCLLKPFDADQLVSVLDEVTGNQPHRSAA